MMWREQLGITEMLFTYLGDFEEFSGWTNWRKILIDILSCHEESRRLQAMSSSKESNGGSIESQNRHVNEKNSFTMFYGQHWIPRPEDSLPVSVADVKHEINAIKTEEEILLDWQEPQHFEPTSSKIDSIEEPLIVDENRSVKENDIAIPTSRQSWDELGDIQHTNSINLSGEILPTNYDPSEIYQSRFPSHAYEHSDGSHRKTPGSSKRSARRRSHACTFCDRVFINTNHLNSHIRSHTGERPFICSICNKSFIIKHHLKRHMKSHLCEKTPSVNVHINAPYVCQLCGKSYTEESAWTNHMRVHTG